MAKGKKEDKNVLNKVSEILLKQIESLGGDTSILTDLSVQPKEIRDFALIIMGMKEVIDIDPMRIITVTGRGKVVKAKAASMLQSDEQRLAAIDSLLGYEDNSELIACLLSFIQDPTQINLWVKKKLEEGSFLVGTNWNSVLNILDDDDLFVIHVNSLNKKTRLFDSPTGIDVIQFMRSENLLKLIAEESVSDYARGLAVRKINDQKFLTRLRKELRLRPDKERFFCLEESLDKRIKELKDLLKKK